MLMSFGLTKAPTYFMDLMDKVFMESFEKFIILFINGMLVYNKSKEEQEVHPWLVL
jgi:hypothetical protein